MISNSLVRQLRIYWVSKGYNPFFLKFSKFPYFFLKAVKRQVKFSTRILFTNYSFVLYTKHSFVYNYETVSILYYSYTLQQHVYSFPYDRVLINLLKKIKSAYRFKKGYPTRNQKTHRNSKTSKKRSYLNVCRFLFTV